MKSELKDLSVELQNNPRELEKFKKDPLKYLKNHGIKIKDLSAGDLKKMGGGHCMMSECHG